MKFAKKIVIVTGATSGIGKETARCFLEAGAKVAVNFHSDDDKKAKTESEFLSLLKQQGRAETDLLMVNADIADPNEVADMFRQIDDHLGQLDILVNNAGMESEKASHLIEPDELLKKVSINLLGPTYCCIEALKRMTKNSAGGNIVNVSSVHEEIPKPGFLPYSIAKGGVRNLTRTLALEYANKGIRVNSVCPGCVDTPMNDFLKDDEKRAEVKSHIPQRSIIEPDEVARLILVLASSDLPHMTGQSLMLDAGLTLFPDFQTNWSS